VTTKTPGTATLRARRVGPFPLGPALLVVAGALFLITRLANLALLPPFVDEGIYVHWSQVIRSDPRQFDFPLIWGKQPLFMWLVALALIPGFDPFLSARLVSVAAGGLGAIAAYLAAGRLYSQRVALVALFLQVLCTYALFHERMALVDSLLATTGTATLLFSLIAFREHRIGGAIGLGLALGAALLTKSSGVLFVFFPIAVLLSARESRRVPLYAASLAMIAGGIVLLLLVPLALSANVGNIFVENRVYTYDLGEALAQPYAVWQANFGLVAGWLSNYLTLPLLALCVAGVAIPLYTRERYGFVLSLFVIAGVVSSVVFGKILYSRYLLAIVPPLLIAGARGLSLLIDRICESGRFPVSRSRLGAQRWRLPLTLAGALILLLPTLHYDFDVIANPEEAALPAEDRRQYIEAWSAGYGTREGVRYLAREAVRQGQIVVIISNHLGTQQVFEILLRDARAVDVRAIGWWDRQPLRPEIAASGPVYAMFDFPRSGGEAFTRLNPQAQRVWWFPKPGGLSWIEIYRVDPS
jgi:hypothetical protein